MTPGVSLRDVVEADLPHFFEHQADPEATRMADFPPRAEPAFRELWARLLRDDELTKRTIVADGVVVGYIVAYREAGRLQIGYWLGQAYWGRGLATAALNLLLEEASERPVFAIVAAHNIA